MESEDQKPITEIPLYTDNFFNESSRKRTMTPEDRLSFIDFLFEHIQTLEKGSRNKISKEIVNAYKEKHPDKKLNESWVYRLLLGGIYRNGDGKYGFTHIDCSVEDVCSNPSMLEKALKNKK